MGYLDLGCSRCVGITRATWLLASSQELMGRERWELGGAFAPPHPLLTGQSSCTSIGKRWLIICCGSAANYYTHTYQHPHTRRKGEAIYVVYKTNSDDDLAFIYLLLSEWIPESFINFNWRKISSYDFRNKLLVPQINFLSHKQINSHKVLGDFAAWSLHLRKCSLGNRIKITLFHLHCKQTWNLLKHCCHLCTLKIVEGPIVVLWATLTKVAHGQKISMLLVMSGKKC